MNHNPSDESANVPPSGQAVVSGGAVLKDDREPYHLNLALQQALSCLDIKLEDELNRFRAKQGTLPADVGAASVKALNWEDRVASYRADSEILTAEIIKPMPPRNIVEDTTNSAELYQRQSSRFTHSEDGPTGGFIVIDGLTTSISSSLNSITVNYAPISLHRQSAQAPLDLNFTNSGEIAPFHDEYSSASQELLRQIRSGYTTSTDPVGHSPGTAAPAPKTKQLLTPLKIGSIAAACFLAGGVAYTALNPNLLATLTATKAIIPTAVATNLIQSPNLAANEFTDLNLSTINTIKSPVVARTSASVIPTSAVGVTTTAPMAIPFSATTKAITTPTAINAQPRLADSLVKSLLPANFHAYVKPSGYRAISPGVKR
jgi:hypothetical protein